jgi:PST family polysaccharide transporter
MLGKAALGSYNVAWNIAEQPQQKFSDLVTRVVPSYFSKVQNDPAALRRYVLTITQAISLLALPAILGLALVADDFVAATLGSNWVNSVLPLQILAVYSATRCLTSFLAPLLNVTGQSRFIMWNHILAAVYFTVAFYLASRWGIVGIALVWPLLYPFVALPLYLQVFKQIDLRWASYWACVRPAVSALIVMFIGLLMFRNTLLSSLGLYYRLAAEVITGAAIYFITLFALHHDELQRLFTMVRGSRR